jgi:uncharacterized protein involved in exopolysaccharide biosynthesis
LDDAHGDVKRETIAPQTHLIHRRRQKAKSSARISTVFQLREKKLARDVSRETFFSPMVAMVREKVNSGRKRSARRVERVGILRYADFALND